MSHESVIAALKKLIKQDLLTIEPEEHAHHVTGESDRTAVILCAALIEDMLLHRLQLLMPTINSDERDRLFNFEGPCGSFSNRVRMAQALRIIDRPTRKQIEIIKEMRNVAAHSHATISFNTREFKEAFAALMPPEARQEIVNWQGPRVRAGFSSFALNLARVLTHENASPDAEGFWAWLRIQKLKRKPSRGTPWEQSPQSHPQKRKDK